MMSEDIVRTIRAEDGPVTVETTDPNGDHLQVEFATVKLLSNGWVECVPVDEGSDPKQFFSPQEVKSVTVEEEESRSGAW